MVFQRKFARLITQYRDIFFPIFRKAQPSFFRVLQRMTKVFNVTSLKYFKLVTLITLVILCNTLKKEGRTFRNIGKNISLYCVISLANFLLLFNLLLIRSSTARGSGTSILLRWSLQKLTSMVFQPIWS